MKPVSEWTRDDKKLIADDVREGLSLDYKSSPSLGRESKQRNDLSKDVSAFANSAGGTIIYGIVEKDQTQIRLIMAAMTHSSARNGSNKRLGRLSSPEFRGL